MQVYQHNETAIHYLDQGSSSPLFFIHGLGADHAMFEPQIAEFSKDYRVIVPDLRGNGLSSQLTGPVDTVLDRQCQDVLGIMDELQIEKAVFSGVSYGGVFNFHFVLMYPERVAGLIITDSFSDTKVQSIQEFLNLVATYLALPMLYFPKLLLPSIKQSYQRWPLAQEYMLQAFENLRSREVILQRLAINKANHTPKLHNYKSPLLGMVGDNVPLLIQYMTRAMDQFEHGELTIIENSFDPSNLCATKKYNSLVRDFLVKIGW
ncbi:MAG: alpha/beta hydrolase [Anaerolineales bacterium]|nr:alpha/beta hydrolase [Anaerolineales bacterium]